MMMRRKHDPLAHPEELIRRVYSYVAYVVGDGADAEDITSTTIERAIRYRASYQPDKGEPVAWLLGIARRCIADRLGEPEALPDEEIDEQPDVRGGSFDDVDRLTVQAAVAALSLRERELVALRHGADLPAKQIAELVGLSTNAVEVALHRVHARLRAELAPHFAPEARRADAS
jgi:RNA polymerase sigma factor (sigma-70 family)